MAYEQHTWQSNEFVTAEKLNNIENGVAYSQGKKWEVTIAANSWTLDDGVYIYTTSLGDITSASWVDASAHGYENYFSDPIDWEIKNNNVVEFSTTSAPTGTVVITVVAWGTVEGTEGEVIVPIYDGVDSTDANKALSAKQGKIINDKVSAIEEAITPFVVTITTGQWSGTGSDRYITVNASNVNENSILIPRYDHASESVLNGPIWCVPGDGSFTIHTTAIPAGSITVVVLFAGTMGEAQYQVLADVYSKAQTDALVAQSKASDWNSLTSYLSSLESGTNAQISYAGKMRTINFQGVSRVHAEGDTLMTLPQEHRPLIQSNNYFSGNIGATSVVIAINGSTGKVTIYMLNGATSTARLYFSATYMVQ